MAKEFKPNKQQSKLINAIKTGKPITINKNRSILRPEQLKQFLDLIKEA